MSVHVCVHVCVCVCVCVIVFLWCWWGRNALVFNGGGSPPATFVWEIWIRCFLSQGPLVISKLKKVNIYPHQRREKSWMQTFSRGNNAMWNANSLVHDLTYISGSIKNSIKVIGFSFSFDGMIHMRYPRRRPPRIQQLLWNNSVLAGDSSSGPLGYLTFLYGHKKYNRGSGRKRTKT